jgi:hypothetical protein
MSIFVILEIVLIINNYLDSKSLINFSSTNKFLRNTIDVTKHLYRKFKKTFLTDEYLMILLKSTRGKNMLIKFFTDPWKLGYVNLFMIKKIPELTDVLYKQQLKWIVTKEENSPGGIKNCSYLTKEKLDIFSYNSVKEGVKFEYFELILAIKTKKDRIVKHIATYQPKSFKYIKPSFYNYDLQIMKILDKNQIELKFRLNKDEFKHLRKDTLNFIFERMKMKQKHLTELSKWIINDNNINVYEYYDLLEVSLEYYPNETRQIIITNALCGGGSITYGMRVDAYIDFEH